MKSFKQNLPYNVPAIILIPTSKYVKGVLTKVYPEKGELIYISFKTFGGTETNVNGAISVKNTAQVETWYRTDIKADCRLVIEDVPYEILGTPENINMNNQCLVFKVKAVKGGA